MLEFVEESVEDDTPHEEADIPPKNDLDSSEIARFADNIWWGG